MPLTLYYLALSPPVRSVDLVIHSLGLNAEYKTVNLLLNEQYTPEYVKLNPLNTIPTVVDEDGFILWESRAIMTYLVSKYGKDDSLYPKDLKKRAIVDQVLHYSNDAWFVTRAVTRALILENAKVIPEDKLTKIKEAQENVEKLLAGKKFLAGDSLTLADYSFVTFVDIMEVICPPGNSYPLTRAWFDRCKSVMKDFDKVNVDGASALVDLLREKLPK